MKSRKIILLLIIVFPKIVFAKTERIDLGYLSENDTYIKEDNDYIDIEKDEFIEIHTNYSEISNINFSILPINLKLYELEVYYKDELIKYTPRVNYYVFKSERLYDNDLETYYTHGNAQSFFVLYLDKSYSVNDLKIKIYTKKQDDSIFDLEIARRVKLNNSIDRWHIITFINDNRSDINYRIDTERKYRYYMEEEIKIDNNIDDNLIQEDFININLESQDTFINEEVIKEDNISECNEEYIDNQNYDSLLSNEYDYYVEEYNDVLNIDYLDKNEDIIDEQLDDLLFNSENIKILNNNEEKYKEISNNNEKNKNNNKVINIKNNTYSIKEKRKRIIKILIACLLIIVDFIIVIIKIKKKNVESI